MKSHTKIYDIYFIEYVTIKDLRIFSVNRKKTVKIYSVNPLYLIINKINGYIDEINGSKYLTLVSTNESKEILKKYEKLWTKKGDHIRTITNNSDH